MIKKTMAVCLLLSAMTVNGWAAPALNKEIAKDLQGFQGKAGVYAKNLTTGKTIQFNQNEIFPTASTSKLLVALATYKYLYPGAEMYKKEQYDQYIEAMMTVSDNDSFYALLGEFDSNHTDTLSKVTKDLRLQRTLIHNEKAYQQYQYHSVTTPLEMAKVFERIYSDSYLDRNKSEQLKDELANSIFHDEIPRYMLTPVFHKVGELDDVLCDVGVIQDGHDPILISFYTSAADHRYSSDFIAAESAKLYNALRRK